MLSAEEVALEMSRLERECMARVVAKIQSQQLGEAWVDLVDDREPIEGCERPAA